MTNNNVAWACLACGVVIEHPSLLVPNNGVVTEHPSKTVESTDLKKSTVDLRKTTLCLKCYRDVGPEKANAYRLEVLNRGKERVSLRSDSLEVTSKL